MRYASRIALIAALLLIGNRGLAQDEGAPAPEAQAEGELPPGHPPVGEGAGESAGEEQEELPSGHPPVNAQATAQRHGAMAGVLSPPNLARAEPSSAVPAGTIRVTVVDVDGRPVPDAPVDIGVRSQMDERSRREARTNASGVALFEGLATGTGQAYRANVPYLGATYSSTPFQLPDDQGYDVRITRLPVTRETRFVFLHLFRVIFEIRDERLHVIHQVELTNAGHETYVFPADGLRVPLPEGATAFQTQAVMTDQRVEEIRGADAYAFRGSLPPGTVRLAYAYDLPIEDETMRVPVELPLRFFGLQVISEAPEGLVVRAPGLPSPQLMDNDGQALWVTQLRQAPSDAPIRNFTVTLSGIPGPSPLRWLAVVLAIGFVLGGVFLLLRGQTEGDQARSARARRRAELLEEARQLEKDLESGEIGPAYRQSRRAEIVRELASLLHAEEAARETKEESPRPKPKGQPARSIR